MVFGPMSDPKVAVGPLDVALAVVGAVVGVAFGPTIEPKVGVGPFGVRLAVNVALGVTGVAVDMLVDGKTVAVGAAATGVPVADVSDG